MILPCPGLIDTLEADPDKPTAVFAHHPPFVVTEGPDPVHFESSAIMQRFRSTLQRYKSIIAIYCGHVHRGVAGHVGDIPVLVMTSIATTLRRGEYPSEMQSCPVYHVHTYQPDWGFTTVLQIVRD